MTDVCTTSRADSARWAKGSPWRAWLFVFTFFLVVYAMTASRGVQWQDSGAHMLRIVTGELVNPRGLALSHPLHYWLGRAAVWIGVFSPAYAITLVSSIAGALAVANVFGCVWSLTGRGWAAIYASCSLGVAHTFWQMATVTEVNTLVAALLSGELWALVLFLKQPARSRLWLIFALGGLGVANHNLAALTLPVLAVVVLLSLRKRQVSVRDAGIAAIIWLLASLPYTSLFVSELSKSGELAATIQSALFGHVFQDEVLSYSMSPGRTLRSVAFIGMNFPSLLLLFSLIGLVRGSGESNPKSVSFALAGGFVIHAVFSLRYPVVDQHTFFIPMYVYLAVFGGVGMARLIGTKSRRLRPLVNVAFVLLFVTPLVYSAIPGVARRMNALGEFQRNKPYRDDYVYLFTPWTVVETSAEQMAKQAVALGEERALIVVQDPMAEPAIRFKVRLLEGRDVKVQRSLTVQALAEAKTTGRRIVLVPRNLEEALPDLPKGHWRREGDLYVQEDDVPRDN